jgi:hypothetical protein
MMEITVEGNPTRLRPVSISRDELLCHMRSMYPSAEVTVVVGADGIGPIG